MNDSATSTTQNSGKLGKPTALVVDDDQTILQILRATCEMLNFEVTTAEDGEEAWEIFRSSWPD
ncbi:MAG: response regulator, partial [bacterium]